MPRVCSVRKPETMYEIMALATLYMIVLPVVKMEPAME